MSDVRYGINKDIEAALDAKLKQEDVDMVLKWLGELTGQTLPKNMHEALKSGVVLCNAMNRLKPGSISNINKMNSPFFQRENINNFLNAARAYGVRDGDLFITEDLYGADTAQNRLVAVLDCLIALGGAAKNNKFNGPTIGIKGAGDKNTDDFKFTVKASGDTSVVSKQVMGSSETQPEHYSLGLRGQIVKSDDAGTAGAVSKQTSGSVVQNAESVRSDKIIRTQGKALDGSVSKQTTGSVVQGSESVRSDKIIKTQAKAFDGSATKQTAGSIHQPAQQRMDGINRLNTTK